MPLNPIVPIGTRATMQGIPSLPPEDDSLASDMLGGVLSGLGYVGRTLDKPGAALRGTLAGRPYELLNLLPFSDTLGITDPRDQVTGRDLLEQYGMLSPNQEGLDAGDVAGFAAEVLLDPLIWVTGPGKALTSAGHKALKSGKILTEAPMIQRAAEISGKYGDDLAGSAGEAAKVLAENSEPLRKLIGIKAPGFKIPFTGIGWEPKQLFQTNLGLSPERAGKLVEKLGYGTFAPARGLRPFFSPNPHIPNAGFNSQAQKLADAVWAGQELEMVKLGDTVDAMRTVERGLKAQLDELRDSTVGQAEFDIRFDTGLRAALEGTAEIREVVKELAGGAKNPEQIEQATKAFTGLWDTMRSHTDETFTKLQDAGVDISTLRDGIDYHPRSPSYIRGVVQHFAEKNNIDLEFANTIARKDVLRGLPGGTEQINTFTSHPALVGFEPVKEVIKSGANKGKTKIVWKPTDVAEEIWGRMDPMGYGKPDMTGVRGSKEYKKAVQEAAGANRVHPRFIDAQAEELRLASEGIFRERRDALDYVTQFIGEALGIKPATKNTGWDITNFRKAVLKKLDSASFDARALDEIEFDRFARDTASNPDFAALGLAGKADDAVDEMLHMVREHLSTSRREPTKADYLEEALGRLDPADPDIALMPGYTPAAMKQFLVHAGELPYAKSPEHIDSAIKAQWLKNGDKLAERVGIESPKRWAKQDLDADQFVEELQSQIKAAQEQPFYTGPKINPHVSKEEFVEQLFDADLGGPKVWGDKDVEGLASYLRSMPDDVMRQGDVVKEFDNAKEAVDFWEKGTLSAHQPLTITKEGDKYAVRLAKGLFSNGALPDEIDYLHRAQHLLGSLQSIRHSLKDSTIANAEIVGESIPEVWKKAGLTERGLKTLAREMFPGVPDAKALENIAELKVDSAVAKSIVKTKAVAQNPKEIGPILDGYKKFLSWFKSSVYLPFPASHSRNYLEGQFKNYTQDMHSFTSHNLAHRLISTGDNIDINYGELNRSREEIIDLLNDHGLNPFMGDTGAAATKMADVSEVPLGRTNAVPTQGILHELFRRPLEQGVTLNPLATVGGPKPVAAVKRLLGKTDDAMTHEKNRFAATRFGENAQLTTEWMNRVPPFLELLSKGWSPAAAARKVKAAQYDYSALSAFEKKWMRSIVPFYTFSSKNLPFWLKELANNPGGTSAQWIRTLNNIQDEQREESGYIPPWLAEGFAFKTGKGKDGRQGYAYSSSLLGFQEAFGRFVPGQGPLGFDWRRIADKHLGMTSPVIQAPLEQLTGRSFFTGKPLDQLHRTPTDYDPVNYAIYKSPASRATALLRKFVDSNKSLSQKALAIFIGGAGVTHQDVAKSANIEMRRIAQEQLKGEPGVYSYENLHVRDIEKLPPEKQKIYLFLKKLRNEYRELKKQ